MKKLLLLFIATMLPIMADAYDYADKGLFYNIKGDGTLEVVGLDAGTTTADILSDVTINGTTYQVTSIGAYAFEGRSDITYLSIPWSVTSIGEYAFIDCGSNLTVNIADPESWCQMQLGNEHSSPLSSAVKVLVHDIETTTINIPEGVTSIGNFTFYQCRCIRSLTIPSSVNSIGSSAFEDCTGLTSLTLSEGLQYIGGSAFQGCTGLQTITIPSTVNTISINAFANCSSITDVYCYAENVPDTHFDTFDATPTERSTLHVPANAVEAYKTSWPWSDFQNIIGIGSTLDDNSKKRTIHVAVAGTLSDFISENEKYQIEELTLTGEINGDDLGLLREMAGAARTERYGRYTPTPGKLSMLDISNVTIVKGGYYYKDEQTSDCDSEYFYLKDDNYLPRVFFNCKSLLSVALPDKLERIASSAFDNTGWYDNQSSGVLYLDNYLLGYKGLPTGSLVIKDGTRLLADNAFYGCSFLSSITIPNSVTSIGSSAFSNCSGLTSITIPNSVTSIGGWAFEGCNGLTSVIIGNSVKSINTYLFGGCSSLASIIVNSENPYYDSRNDCNAIIEKSSNSLVFGCKNTIIPNSVTSIGSSAFSNCSGLTSITIPNSVTSIGSSAFSNCSGLTSVIIGNGVTSIGGDAFSNCSGLTSVIIGNGVTSIGGEAFSNCSGLTSVTIPNSVTSIGWDVFDGCSSLATITSEIENPFEIGYRVFGGNTYTTATLIVPKGKKSTYQATAGWKNFTNIIEDGSIGCLFEVDGIKYRIEENNTVSIMSGITKTGDVVIPDQVAYKGNVYSVTIIGFCAFNNCRGLRSVTIPNSITSIEYEAFCDCFNLSSVHITDLEAWCNIKFDFSDSNPLTYAHHLFLNGEEIIDLVIPNNVTTIRGWSFIGCSRLGSLTIPNSINSIGSSAFSSCSGLKNIVSEIENPFAIDASVFSKEIYSTATLIVPKGTKAAYQATEGWNLFQKIIEADGDVIVTENDVTYTTEGNTAVVSMSISAKGEVKIEESVEVDGMTYQVTAIAAGAFQGNVEITSIVIPNTIETIGASAFEGCTGISTIIIGKAVREIANRAFAEIFNIGTRSDGKGIDVYCYAEDVPNTGIDAFDGTPTELSTLHVPASAIEKYRASWPWSDFKEIVALEEEGPDGIMSIKQSENSDCEYYDLTGRKVNHPQKGIYIKNGKKVIINN